jgi:hypothetical protein
MINLTSYSHIKPVVFLSLRDLRVTIRSFSPVDCNLDNLKASRLHIIDISCIPTPCTLTEEDILPVIEQIRGYEQLQEVNLLYKGGYRNLLVLMNILKK